MAESKIRAINVVEQVQTTAQSGTTITAYKIGNIVQARIDISDVPSGAWKTVGQISAKPKVPASVIAVNGSVTGFGRIDVGSNGNVAVYQATGSLQGFYGVTIYYICE